MSVKLRFLILITIICFINGAIIAQKTTKTFQNEQIKVGAEMFDNYLPLIKNKKVALVVNQTSVIGADKKHIVDELLSKGISIKKILAPEHGFRGVADAGEHVDNTVDAKTGIPIVSIYGKNRKPSPEDLSGIDIILLDIQDVGVRFYTYISTLEYILEAGAENKIPVIVLDRPNPNGHYVDGPILDKSLKSFIGMQAVPTVYGMTMGEYGQMLNTEGWLENKVKADLKVIKCQGYDHTTFYELPVKPSPNIPNMHAVYLYPSLCLFEGTNVSLGRGTNKQFQIYGSPFYPKDKASFKFTPMPNEGAKTPPHEGKECYGVDLSGLNIKDLQKLARIDLKYILEYYKGYKTTPEPFFLKSNFFEKLAGNYDLRLQIIDEKSEAQIKAGWQADIARFKKIRKKYLLYHDFE